MSRRWWLWVCSVCALAVLIITLSGCRITINVVSTEGLAFTLKPDGTYSVSAGEGFCAVDLKIPEKYRSKAVTEIADDGFVGCETIDTVFIPEGITVIGDHAFDNCTSLSSIVLPTTLKSIGDYAFSGCTELATLTVPDSVEVIGFGALNSCDSISSITLPFIGDRAVKPRHWYLGYIFEAESYEGQVKDIPRSLTSVTLSGECTIVPNFAFYNCKYITEINLPDTVTRIGGHSFYNCIGLTSIVLPAGVTEIGPEGFGGCSNIEKIQFKGTREQWFEMNRYSSWISGSFKVECTDTILSVSVR